MLKRRSFLRGWRPFSVASISGNKHSQCPWLSGLQIGWCRRLRPGRICVFWCFCNLFDWPMAVHKNTTKWPCAMGNGVDGLWAWGSCRCRKTWLWRYATGSSSEFARSPVKQDIRKDVRRCMMGWCCSEAEKYGRRCRISGSSRSFAANVSFPGLDLQNAKCAHSRMTELHRIAWYYHWPWMQQVRTGRFSANSITSSQTDGWTASEGTSMVIDRVGPWWLSKRLASFFV